MFYLLAFILGVITGAFTYGFVAGVNVINRENEIYMEGFVAGQKDKGEKNDI